MLIPYKCDCICILYCIVYYLRGRIFTSCVTSVPLNRLSVGYYIKCLVFLSLLMTYWVGNKREMGSPLQMSKIFSELPFFIIVKNVGFQQ